MQTNREVRDTKAIKGFSIITPAYRSAKFLKECLESIESQTYFKEHPNYEILLGIDACDETKQEALKLKYKNLRVFWFPKRVGAYIIRNTLVNKSAFNYLTFFDSDDIMKNNFISLTIGEAGELPVRYLWEDLWEIPTKKYKPFASHGVVSMFKSQFDEFGGFMPWRHSADTELIVRMKRFGVKWTLVLMPSFIRRRHEDSIVENKNTQEKYTLLMSTKSLPQKIPRITSYCEKI